MCRVDRFRSDPPQYRDLCSDCDRAEACSSRRRPRRPIFFCEEFEVFGATLASESERAVREEPREARSGKTRIGLCVNCDYADACTLPKPEGGIWHCEEYR